ncbi:hypothetical protein FPV67DRAFT_1788009 [Lyophyllum atratum]|nr:hypothetical protein FPV67DRAFT_1788009 [Lyophyllum atratum]
MVVERYQPLSLERPKYQAPPPPPSWSTWVQFKHSLEVGRIESPFQLPSPNYRSGVRIHLSSPSHDATPWEAWELDMDFFTALSRWTLELPEDTLDRLFNDVCGAIEHNREFIEVIPDSVFPTRGLLKSLEHITKLDNVCVA